MLELKPGAPTQSLLQELPQIRQELLNAGGGMAWQDGQRYYLRAVERLTSHFENSFLDGWYDRLYGGGFWAVRDMTENSPRPFPLLKAEAGRLARWLDDIERELKRVAREDDDLESNATRLVFDTSALVREGSFDTVDWCNWAKADRVRLVVPILVVRELDNLKNFGKAPLARKRLRLIYELLGDKGRGPADVGKGITLELLMDPQGHVRSASNDEEIIRRAAYLQGRLGGPLKLVTGDYTMLFTAQAGGIAAELTPAELMMPTVG